MRLTQILALALPLLVSASVDDQTVLSPSPMAHDPLSIVTPEIQSTTRPTLTDLLTIESSASIYFSYARDTAFAKEFSAEHGQLTLLVPTNKAVMARARKPHQGPEPVDPKIELTEQQFDEQTRRNVERWVSAHIIPSRISLSDLPVTYDTMLDGKSVTFTPTKGKKDSPDWSRVTLEHDIHVIDMKEGANGVIYMIDGTVKP